MTSATLRGWLRTGLPSLLVLAACTGDATAPREGLPGGLAAGIYPAVTLAAAEAGGTRVDLYLERVEVPAGLAAYQGEIAWDPELLTLASVQLPAGIAGSAHQSAPGRVRFSGSAAQGVGDGPALTLVFGRGGRVAREGITVTLEEVTSGDFTDVTALAVSGPPFLVRR